MDFGFLPSNGNINDNDSNDDGDDRPKAGAAGGAGGGGGDGGSGIQDFSQEEGGFGHPPHAPYPPPAWRFSERGGGQETDGDDVKGGGGARGEAGSVEADGVFREELEVLSSSLRKDFELKVGDTRHYRLETGVGRAPPEALP